jgi:hypothetical protein
LSNDVVKFNTLDILIIKKLFILRAGFGYNLLLLLISEYSIDFSSPILYVIGMSAIEVVLSHFDQIESAIAPLSGTPV